VIALGFSVFFEEECVMNRGMVTKVMLAALAALAWADAAQAGLIFRRGNRVNDCCCYGYGYGWSGYGYGYAYAPRMYGGSMYVSGYVDPCACPTTTVAGYTMPGTTYAAGYGDPSMYGRQTAPPPMHGGQASGAIAPDRGRLRVQVPAPDARLWLNNQMIQLGGAERVFDVGVAGGQPQKMTLTVQWVKDGREIVRKKEVEVRPGQEVTVNIQETDTEFAPNGERVPVTPNPNQQPPKPDIP
jgi:uncharacterized protein (TIGR03000 family)